MAMDVEKMLDNLKVAAIASDPDFNITYINKRGEELFKALMNADNTCRVKYARVPQT